jgi:hypothetical protein
MELSLRPRWTPDLRCAICHDVLQEGVVCARCAVRYHRECRAHLERCPSLGCDGRPALEAMEPESPRTRFTCLTLAIGTALAAVLLAAWFPNLYRAQKIGNECSAIGALKTICTAQSIFREGDKEHDGNLDYGMLSELANTGLVDSVLGSGTKQGYTFQATYSFATSEFLWFGVANPTIPGTSGERSFATNQTGVIFYTTAGPLSIDTNTCFLSSNGRLVTTGK